MKNTMSFLSHIHKLWHRFTPPQHLFLAEWFPVLLDMFEKERFGSRVIHGGWYQTEQGLIFEKLQSSTSSSPPLYAVTIVPLPVVKIGNKLYALSISEITMASAFFTSPILPEIEARRLDLTIAPVYKSIAPVSVQFTRTKELKLHGWQRYSIQFAQGKDLTSEQARFVKSVFDAALAML